MCFLICFEYVLLMGLPAEKKDNAALPQAEESRRVVHSVFFKSIAAVCGHPAGPIVPCAPM